MFGSMSGNDVAERSTMAGPNETLASPTEDPVLYVPKPRLPSPSKATMHERYTFGLIHGAWHQGKHWELLEDELQALGHTTIAPDLPIDEIDKSIEDDTAAVADALADHDNIVLVAHSRGAETIPRLIAREQSTRFLGVVILNSGGPYGFRPEPAFPGEPELPRHSPLYSAGVQETDNGLTAYDPSYARRLFYSGAGEEIALEAIRSLRQQRKPDLAVNGSARLPDTLPAYFILGTEDKVLNLERVRRVAIQWLGKQAIELPVDHTPQISNPALLAKVLVVLARSAELERAQSGLRH